MTASIEATQYKDLDNTPMNLFSLSPRALLNKEIPPKDSKRMLSLSNCFRRIVVQACALLQCPKLFETVVAFVDCSQRQPPRTSSSL
eukprot:272963-Amphidinium_carterae.1